jgi:hypothetical protein
MRSPLCAGRMSTNQQLLRDESFPFVADLVLGFTDGLPHGVTLQISADFCHHDFAAAERLGIAVLKHY